MELLLSDLKKGLRFGRSLPTPFQAWHEFIKVRIYVAAVTTILTYGGEIWNTTDKQMVRLETLRRILRIRWFHRVKNEEVLRRATIKPIRDLICNKRMSWFGHVVKMPAERLPRYLQVEWEPKHGKRSRLRST